MTESETTHEEAFQAKWEALRAKNVPERVPSPAEQLTADVAPVEEPDAPADAPANATPDATSTEQAPEGGSVASDAPDAPEGESEAEGVEDALTDALTGRPRKTREDHLAEREALRQRALDLTGDEDVAKALAGNVKADAAEKFLARWQRLVESEQAGQPPSTDAAAGEAAVSDRSGAEVRRLLEQGVRQKKPRQPWLA